jgi:peptidoglycan hydrolase-like protein with peptidoglycan-binding domain
MGSAATVALFAMVRASSPGLTVAVAAVMKNSRAILSLLLLAAISAGCSDATDGDAYDEDAPAGGPLAGEALTWPLVGNGDAGDLVAAVQFLLISRGQSVVADGSFGGGTEAAVIAFQRSNRLVADGLVGGGTWEALISDVKPGSFGAAVQAAQQLLVKAGNPIAVDGDAGNNTVNAITAFQRSKCLGTTGVVGRFTWNSLAAGRTYCTPTGGGEWSYILPEDHGVRDDSQGDGHFGGSRPSGPHSGVDFLAAVGTPLLAVCDTGDVQTGFESRYGNWVQLTCTVPTSLTGGRAMWASVLYAHLNTVAVANGDRVAKGTQIGTVGKTGNAAGAGIGPHVHWEVAIHGSRLDAFNELHASADNSGNPTATAFDTTFRQACLTPNGISTRTGPVMRGRRVDPYLMLVCTVRGKPRLTGSPLQSLEAWSQHFSATGFDINVGR